MSRSSRKQEAICWKPLKKLATKQSPAVVGALRKHHTKQTRPSV